MMWMVGPELGRWRVERREGGELHPSRGLDGLSEELGWWVGGLDYGSDGGDRLEVSGLAEGVASKASGRKVNLTSQSAFLTEQLASPPSSTVTCTRPSSISLLREPLTVRSQTGRSV